MEGVGWRGRLPLISWLHSSPPEFLCTTRRLCASVGKKWNNDCEQGGEISPESSRDVFVRKLPIL